MDEKTKDFLICVGLGLSVVLIPTSILTGVMYYIKTIDGSFVYKINLYVVCACALLFSEITYLFMVKNTDTEDFKDGSTLPLLGLKFCALMIGALAIFVIAPGLGVMIIGIQEMIKAGAEFIGSKSKIVIEILFIIITVSLFFIANVLVGKKILEKEK